MAKGKNDITIRIGAKTDQFISGLNKVKKSTRNLEADLAQVARQSAIAFAALAASVGLSVKAFADFETALVGVGKTTDIADAELDKFGRDIQALSNRIPVATNELLNIAQAAGQLGVRGTDNLIKFSETIAKLGRASNIAGQEAATALVRILGLSRDGIEDIDRFSSVIVELGNNFAATESEIVAVANRVAQGVSIFGVASADIAGIATALKSVGLRAEQAGSTLGRSFQAIAKTIGDGGLAFERLQEITNMTGDQLKKTFRDDAAEVFRVFIEGLNKIPADELSRELANFGLSGVEVIQVLGSLSSRSDILNDALSRARKEFQENTALNKEFAKQAATLNAELQVTANQFTNLAVSIGTEFVPLVRELNEIVRGLIKSFSELDDDTKKFIADLTIGITAVVGATAALSALGLVLLGLKNGFLAAAGAVTVLSRALALTPVGRVIAVITTAIGLVITFQDELKQLAGIQSDFNDELKEVGDLYREANQLSGEAAKLAREEAEAKKVLVEQLLQEEIARKRGRLEVQAKRVERLGTSSGTAREQGTSRGAELARSQFEAAASNARELSSEISLLEEKLIALNEVGKAEVGVEGGVEGTLQQITAPGQGNKVRAETEDILAAREERAERLRGLEVEINEINDALDEERDIVEQEKLQIELEERQRIIAQFATEEEKRELAKQQRIRNADRKAKDELKKAEVDLAAERQKTNDLVLSNSIQLFQGMVKEGSAAAKALFLIDKARAIAATLISGQQAAALAIATVPPPAGEAIAAQRIVQSQINAAFIGATALTGFQDGGLVRAAGGSGSGDVVPAMLADRELVVPSQNFEDVIQGEIRRRGFVEGGETADADNEDEPRATEVEITLQDDAAEFITAKQKENRILRIDE